MNIFVQYNFCASECKRRCLCGVQVCYNPNAAHLLCIHTWHYVNLGSE